MLGLINALLRIDRENEYIVFYNDPAHLGTFSAAREIVLNGKNPLLRLVREHFLLPRACRKERVDLLHCPKSAIPYFTSCPTVVTLHDLIPLKHPETEKFAAQVYWRLQIPIAARRSDYIITDSEHARQEIMADFQVAPDRISAIMLGFDPAMAMVRDHGTAAGIRKKYGIPEVYILYVGTIQPRKNLDTLVEAFNILKKDRKIAEKLVVVGRKGWLYEQLFARIKALGLDNEVIFTGFVPDDELPYIYDAARVFVYLSFFEGFGLPPLEAMACGIPVVTSNTTSLPEVVGEAGIALPPRDTAGIAEAMFKVLDNADLAMDMSRMGRARAELFSWEAAARQTLDVYEKVVRNRVNRCCGTT